MPFLAALLHLARVASRLINLCSVVNGVDVRITLNVFTNREVAQVMRDFLILS